MNVEAYWFSSKDNVFKEEKSGKRKSSHLYIYSKNVGQEEKKDIKINNFDDRFRKAKVDVR